MEHFHPRSFVAPAFVRRRGASRRDRRPRRCSSRPPMIQTARMPAMDASVGGSPRPDFADDSAGSGGMDAISVPGTCSVLASPCTTSAVHQSLTCLAAEGRVRKRLYRPRADNGDASRKQGLSLPFTKSTAAPSADQKPASHARRRSTLIQNKGSLLGPRPLENSKRLDGFRRSRMA